MADPLTHHVVGHASGWEILVTCSLLFSTLAVSFQ